MYCVTLLLFILAGCGSRSSDGPVLHSAKPKLQKLFTEEEIEKEEAQAQTGVAEAGKAAGQLIRKFAGQKAETPLLGADAGLHLSAAKTHGNLATAKQNHNRLTDWLNQNPNHPKYLEKKKALDKLTKDIQLHKAHTNKKQFLSTAMHHINQPVAG